MNDKGTSKGLNLQAYILSPGISTAHKSYLVLSMVMILSALALDIAAAEETVTGKSSNSDVCAAILLSACVLQLLDTAATIQL